MDESDPIRPDELDGLFAQLVAQAPCAVAVSGGSDSTALMVLFADWLGRRGQTSARHTVLTVDHGLRADSAEEARCVAVAAERLGYRHATLVWEGTKPQTGIQAAARKARYRLMGDCMRAHGISLLLTAHTRDDQAETLLMRLARGSGLDGLSAMAPLAPLADDGLPGSGTRGARLIARPLLGVAKVRLRATLKARGIAWVEDPANAAPQFERSRLRAARAELDTLGLTDAMLALSAGRLLRARRAIDRIVEQFCDPHAGAVVTDPCGIFTIARARLHQGGEEIALRVLDRAIAAAGGEQEPVPLSRLEAIAVAICSDVPKPGRWTLSRALVTADESTVVIEREPGRDPLPELTLAPGSEALWDGRFQVSVAPPFSGGPVRVCALAAAKLRELQQWGVVAAMVPARAARMSPSFWHKGELIAVPSLQYWTPPHGCETVAATFVGLGKLSRDVQRESGEAPPTP